MTGGSKPVEFSFVSYQGPEAPKDVADQTVVRHHASRNVATTRRQRNNYGGHNQRQYRVVYMNDDCQHLVLYSPLQTPGQPEMNKFFSMMSLVSPIAGLHLGIATLSQFATDESLAGDVFRAPLPFSKLDSRQLLSFIPSRYSSICSVTHAVDCLTTRLEQIMFHAALSSTQEVIVLQHYTSALQATQEAIDNEAKRMAPETLCATELLGIFELLKTQPDRLAWMRHVAGTTELIRLRGPHRFQSEFELALFMAHVGPMVVEAYLNIKECFLVEESWQRVMHAAIHSDSSIPPDQRSLVYELWSHIVQGPNNFVQIANLILSSTPPSQQAIDNAIGSLQRDEDHLRRWLEMARDLELVGSAAERQGVFFTPSLWSGGACNGPLERILCPVLQGTYLMCYIIKARLLASISPGRFHNAELECQALAHEILALEADPTVYRDGGIFAGLFLSQTLWVSRAIRDTKDDWASSITEHTTGIVARTDGMIESWKFRKWCDEMRRG
ncbi:hypothetical protein MKX08_007672 [Trichoderma sp. CBMAI-0020]|nr:hypothetical protein MKX08_007672 [Trichoderma sp. CBMAI-0020]